MKDHRQRLTITIDIADEPGNDRLAIDTLITVVRHLEHDAVYPVLIRLELGPAPPTG